MGLELTGRIDGTVLYAGKPLPQALTELLDEAVNLLGECGARLCLYEGTYNLRMECENVRERYDRFVRENDV